MEADYTMLLRSITLMIACLGGIFSIFLGWKLYTKGIESAVQSDLSTDSKFSLKVSAVGPGVFFALFGMYIIIKIVSMQAEVTEEIPVEAVEARSWLTDIAPIPAAHAATTKAATSKTCKTVAVKQCLVRRRSSKQYDGAEITVEDVNRALDASLAALRNADVPADEERALIGNIRTLTEMRESTDEGQTQ